MEQKLDTGLVSQKTIESIRPDIESMLALLMPMLGDRKEKQRILQDALETIEARYRVGELSIEKYEIERQRIQSEKQLIEKKKALTIENVAKQETAFKIIEEADSLLKEENFNEAIEEYQKALRLFNDIGWTGGYLKLLEDTIQDILIKKQEKREDTST